MKKFYILLIPFVQLVHGQNNTYDSLEARIAMESTDENKLPILFQLVNKAMDNDLLKALAYAKQGSSLAGTINNKNWQPKFYEIEAKVRSSIMQLDTASILLDKAVAGYKAINDIKGQATALFRVAWMHKKKGEIEKAMKVDMEALRLMESIKDQSGTSMAFNKLSEDLWRQARLKEAMDYAMKSVEIAEKTKVPFDRLFAYFTVANVYISMSDNKEALKYYDKAAALIPSAHLPSMDIASLTNSRGNAYKRLARYPEALKEYEMAFSLSKKIKLPTGIAVGFANLGEVNLLMGNYEKALEYQLETVRLQEKDHDNSNLKENYKHVSDIYEQMGKHKEALQFYKKALTLTDSLAIITNDETMANLLAQYETEKKEATIASQHVQLVQQKRVQWLGIGLAILLAGFLFILYRSYRVRTKANRLLAVKNAENELLLKEIHHRVKNNLEIVSSLLALQSSQIDDPNTKEAMEESQNRVQSIGIVHQKLYQGNNLGAIEMKDYFVNLSESVLDSFGTGKRVTIECVMEKLDVDIDTAVPLGLIVNELLTNALKYAFPKGRDGKMLIRLEKSNDGILHLEVSDNGVGKSGITKGTGFGGQLVSLLTRQLGGSMREENSNGTRIYFDFKADKVA